MHFLIPLGFEPGLYRVAKVIDYGPFEHGTRVSQYGEFEIAE